MKISIIGTGYVGLVTGVCLAEKGHQIICVDIDREKVEKINQSILPFFESGLEELLKKNIHGNLQATTNLRQAIMETDLSFVTVPTPFSDGEIDLSYIKEVAQQIGEVLRGKSSYHLVAVKSTVVPGTTDGVVLPTLEKASGKRAGVDFGVGMNPEFLREGEAIQDCMFPDRIILGGMDAKSIMVMDGVYDIFPKVAKLRTSNKAAEMIKYTANSLLATMISFSNEIANLCSAIGVDAVDVMRGVHMDKRLTPILPNGERIVPAFTTYLEAGCGFGGSCFPKDVKALNAYGAKMGNPMRLLEMVIEINQKQPEKILSLLRKHFPVLNGVQVAVLGLAFKPGTDDVRESPAIPIIEMLLKQGAKVKAYDPVAKLDNGDVVFCAGLAETIDGIDAILIVTRWKEFEHIPVLLRNWNQSPLVIDGRRMLPKNSVIKYEGIGL